MKNARNKLALDAERIPIIHLWGNLLVPMQGDISDSQAEWLRRELLHRIRNTDVSGLVIDVSGVGVIDSHLCGLLASLAAAAELMGVRSLVCGMTPDIVMTFQAMAIDFGDLEPAPSLEEALARLGLRPERKAEKDVEPAGYSMGAVRNGVQDIERSA